jgi:hypothetical protein
MPATLSILTNVFTVPAERAKAIAMWSAVSGLGVAIGPTLGGSLLEHFGWGSIFTVNLPIVALALVTGRLVVPPSKNPHPKALDLFGAVTSIAGVVALVYAIIRAPTYGWLSARTIGIGAVGVALLAAWVAFELRSSHPMVDLRVFRNARFSAASFSVTMIFLALFGWLFLLSQQMQFVLGYNTLQAGVRALPFAIAIGAVSQPAAKLAARAGTKAVVTAGLAMMLPRWRPQRGHHGVGRLVALHQPSAAGPGPRAGTVRRPGQGLGRRGRHRRPARTRIGRSQPDRRRPPGLRYRLGPRHARGRGRRPARLPRGRPVPARPGPRRSPRRP